MKPYWFEVMSNGNILLSNYEVKGYNVIGANSAEEAVEWIKKQVAIADTLEKKVVSESSVSSYQWEQMVRRLAKPGTEILRELTDSRIDLLHAAVGICGEAGELLDTIKKHVIYNKPIDLNNIIEELGDLEFYMEQLRSNTGVLITRSYTLKANYEKLSKRYSSGSYSDTQAQVRADKISD